MEAQVEHHRLECIAPLLEVLVEQDQLVAGEMLLLQQAVVVVVEI
jgi:hypothetical protein